MPSPVPFPDLDTAWLDRLRAEYAATLRRHLAALAEAAPERAIYAWDAVANDHRQLLALDHAAGATADELRRRLVDAARAQCEVLERRGPPGAPRNRDLATGHSRSSYLAMCMALAGGDAALAATLAPLVWDPPGAAYIGAGSVLCTPEQLALAEALKQLLLGDTAAAAAALARVKRITGDAVGELLMLRGLVESDPARFLDGLKRQLDAHAQLAAETDVSELPDTFLCLPALGLAALALRRRLVDLAQLPDGDAHFPRELLATAEGAAP